MAQATTAARWMQRLRHRAAAPQPDFADHGTAFGLELSMQPDAAVPAPARRSGPARPSWWRRLAGRSGPAGI
jgi:hypothetical protein